ncbi:M23 family metallopeptidase [Actinoplanes sp. NPDC051851]|uniref:M23 family metallopeptidase n=1 Tax=Actinoplanes sp. NPDC051851 TaxID=3154753 RepID=UPI00342987FF
MTALLCALGVAGPVLVVPVMPAVPAAADRGDDAARANRAVRRAEALLESAGAGARAAAQRLEIATAALPVAQRRVATTRGVVIATRVQANTAAQRAEQSRQAYASVAVDYEAAAKRVAGARDRVDEIAAASYMGSSFSRLNVLVSATGPADLLDRMQLVDEAVRRENTDIRTLIAARRDARIAQDRAGAAKRAAEAAAADAAARLREAQAAQNSAVRASRDVYRLVLARQAALSAARAQRATVLAQYQAAVVAERRIRASMRGWETRSGYTGRYAGGLLTMPVHGWKSSNFGNRYDPYYGVWQLHAGTDFAAGSGTPIRAAAQGRVIQAGWAGGYGNYTCINHGQLMGTSFSTCYGHQSRIYVHVGEYVHRGEVIGRVGSTGASTGAHLHFETRFAGTPRNPLNYLPHCLC